jgi:hypothetical protein
VAEDEIVDRHRLAVRRLRQIQDRRRFLVPSGQVEAERTAAAAAIVPVAATQLGDALLPLLLSL